MTIDLWDQLDETTWHQPLPPLRWDDVISEQPESMIISKDLGEFWINDPRFAGQSSWPTAEKAKEAAQAVLDELWQISAAEIAKSVGLDPSVWAYRYFDGAHGFGELSGDGIIWLSGQDWHGSRGGVEYGPAASVEDAVAWFEGVANRLN